MKCSSVTKSMMELILDVLEDAKSRKYSKNFLDDFPSDSTNWFNCKINKANLGNLYLFWDGIAWREPDILTPRKVKHGVIDFKKINYDAKLMNTTQLNEIINLKKNIETSNFQNSEPFPILIGLDKGSPLLILDGNHRLAALWWAARKNNQINLNISVWIGFSPDMIKYNYYERLLQTLIS